MSILNDVAHAIFNNLYLHERNLPCETIDVCDKFGVIPGYYLKRHMKKLGIKKSHIKFVCVNLYKLKTLRILIDVLDPKIKMSNFLKHIILSSITSNDLSKKIDILKSGLCITEIYAIMTYLNVGCLIFDKEKAVYYDNNPSSNNVIVFRFNDSSNLDFCGVYDSINSIVNHRDIF